jgi:hypothetical protein
MLKDFLKIGKDWVYFGYARNWEAVPKPKGLAHLPRCVICRLAVEIEGRANFYCWNCWKICIRPNEAVQYGGLIKYVLEMAMKNPSFHGKFFVGKARPVVVIRVGSKEERDLLFSKILEDLKKVGLYPMDSQKRWWRRGCDHFDSILGKWKKWKDPVPIGQRMVNEILRFSKQRDLSQLNEW